MCIDGGLSVVFKLLDIFKQECKLASCIEEEEEASRVKGDSSWASRRSHDRRGETGKKLGSRLIAHSRLGVPGSHDRRGETGKKLGSRLIAHSKFGV
ncbi:hypothetical protein CDL15_Pgr027123 [Punica granatum]|uniref:Uncharacterized protein n=1 Tax=Punica granatum TaxID=22663 RepID=A0A218X6Y0_PUNGR|nr:hypothetical protein CDL15_Pgr027123 [Punica granatum]